MATGAQIGSEDERNKVRMEKDKGIQSLWSGRQPRNCRGP